MSQPADAYSRGLPVPFFVQLLLPVSAGGRPAPRARPILLGSQTLKAL